MAKSPPPLQPSGLMRSHLTEGRSRVAALWLSVAAAAALGWALPLVSGALLAASLSAAVGEQAPLLSLERPGPSDVDGFSTFQRSADALVEPRLGSALGSGSAVVTAGPLVPAVLDDLPAPAQLGHQQLTAAYYDDLGSHVVVTAGYLPPEGLGGGDIAVTMSQAGADAAGLRLSDHLCANTAAQAVVCVRLVGLWNPISAADPFWASKPPRLQLVMGRYDIFQLLQVAPLPQVASARRYVVDPARVDGVAGLAGQVEDLRTQAHSLGGGARLTTSLDAVYARYEEGRRAVGLTVSLAIVGLEAGALCLVALAAARVVEPMRRDIQLLRAGGWPAGRAWRCLWSGLAVPVMASVTAGLVAGALAGPLLWGDGWAGAVASAMPEALGAAGAAVLLTLLVTWALVSSSSGNREHASTHGALAPLAGFGAGGGPARLLAARQLGWRPGQHLLFAALLLVALTVAGFCAGSLMLGPSSVAAVPSLHGARLALLDACLAVCVATVLVGFSLHFGDIARARRAEYAGLVLHGLSPGTIRASLAVEQLVLVAACGLVGIVPGVVVAAALGPPGGVDGWGVLTALVAGGVLAVGLRMAAAATGRAERRSELVDELRRAI